MMGTRLKGPLVVMYVITFVFAISSVISSLRTHSQAQAVHYLVK